MTLRSHNQWLIVACAVLSAACAVANESSTPSDLSTARSQPVKDAWIDTRLETAYLFNRHLNNFTIQTDVDRGAVLLTGTVRSDIDRDLAEEIAKSLDGVRSVNNQLIVKETLEVTKSNAADRNFGQKVDDATTTARIKTQLLANKNLHGLEINVDTRNSVVTLAGKVANDAEKQLAEYIASNTPDVVSVSNELQIVTTDEAPTG